MLGITLGVAALIIVLSVMNGFQKEVRERMLAAIAHVEVFEGHGGSLEDWRAVADATLRHPRVKAAAPFVVSQALITRGDEMKGALVRGIDPEAEALVTPLAAQMKTEMARLRPGSFGVLVGAQLARSLGVRAGDQLTIVTPSGQMTPGGVMPRLKQVTVAGLFEVGHYQYDSTLVLMHIDDAARLFRSGGPQGVQLRLDDQQAARAVAADLVRGLPAGLAVRDWTRTNAEWYDAVQLEKRMMAIILTLIVAVAAFNLVSTLVMTVTDKRADIAILRTLGASPRSIMGIVIVQGAASGVMGTLGGLALGLGVAFNIDVIVPARARQVNPSVLPGSINRNTRKPSDPQAADIVPIALISLALAFLATLSPSWRASRINPAEALRYE